MTDQEFSTLISKTSKKNRIIGLFFLIFGLGMLAVLTLTNQNLTTGLTIGAWVIISLLIFLGVFSIAMASKTLSQINNGTHPLINAIQTGDQSYVVWFHEQVITTENIQATATHQFWIYNKNNKSTIVSIKRTQTQELFDYLATRFPNAIMGYSTENRDLYKQRIA